MMKSSLAMLVALSAFSTGAFAASDEPRYIGVALGGSKFDTDCFGASSCDDSGEGGKLYAGYRFPNGLAIEGSYFRFGKASAVFNVGGVPVDGSGTGYGYTLGAAYFRDFAANWYASARLAAAFTKTTIKLSGPGGSASDSDSGTAPYFGVSIGYRFMPDASLVLGADFTRFKYEDVKTDGRLIYVGAEVTW